MGLAAVFHQDGVQFDGESFRSRGTDSADDLAKVVSPGRSGVGSGIEAVERDVDGVDPGCSKAACPSGIGPRSGFWVAEEAAVGGNTQILDPLDGGESTHEFDCPSSDERLPAGDTQLAHTECGCDPAHPLDFLVAEKVFPGHPGLALLGHAVEAPLVAAVGDRDPQVGDFVAESVFNHESVNCVDFGGAAGRLLVYDKGIRVKVSGNRSSGLPDVGCLGIAMKAR